MKEYQIVSLKQDGRLVPDGYDMRTVNEISVFCNEYGWSFDTEKEAEDEIKNLLKQKEYKWKTFSIIPIYTN